MWWQATCTLPGGGTADIWSVCTAPTCDFNSSGNLQFVLSWCSWSWQTTCVYEWVTYVEDISTSTWFPEYISVATGLQSICIEENITWEFNYIYANNIPVYYWSINGACECWELTECSNEPWKALWDVCWSFNGNDITFVEWSTAWSCQCPCPGEYWIYSASDFPISWNAISCNGADDGALSLTSSNTWAPLSAFSISWSNWWWSWPSINGLSVWSYTATLQPIWSDPACSFDIWPNPITEPQEVTFTTSPTDPSCTNDDGVISVSAAGGNNSFTYTLWWDGSGSNTSGTFSWLSAWTYTITVTDTSSPVCSAWSTETVTLGDNTCADDNNVCNGTEQCNITTKACESVNPLDEDDGIACTDDACDPINWISNTPNDTLCGNDDNDVCTTPTCSATNGCEEVFDVGNNASCVCTQADCDVLASSQWVCFASTCEASWECSPAIATPWCVPWCMDTAATNYNPSATEDDGSCDFLWCTDTGANNYDANATTDDGSCTYNGCSWTTCSNSLPHAWVSCSANIDCSPIEPWCTDAGANNYDASATTDDGSCTYNGCAWTTCSNSLPHAWVSCSADIDCSPTTPWCTDGAANNYNATATTDDGSCVYNGCVWMVCSTNVSTNNNQWCSADTECWWAPWCMDGGANNYNASATTDDGSCTYNGCAWTTCSNSLPHAWVSCSADAECSEPDEEEGCTDSSANNYNATATTDDGSCIYNGCEWTTCSNTLSYNNNIWCSADIECANPILWCMDGAANNYDNIATSDDGSCRYDGCDWITCSTTLTSNNGVWCSTNAECNIPWCTDTGASNYNPNATTDDGSCEFPTFTCSDFFSFTPSTAWINEDISVSVGPQPTWFVWNSLVWESWTTETSFWDGTFTQQYPAPGTYTVTLNYTDDQWWISSCPGTFIVTMDDIPWVCNPPQIEYDVNFDLASNPSYITCKTWTPLADGSGTPIIAYDIATNIWTWDCEWINGSQVIDEDCSLMKQRCGDGTEQSDQWEECDDGNNVNGDWCSDTCQDEEFECEVDPSLGSIEAGNSDPASFQDVIFCNTVAWDGADQDATPDNKYRDRVWSEAWCDPANNCQRYQEAECWSLHESTQILFSKRKHIDPLEWCDFGDVPTATNGGNYTFEATWWTFPFTAKWLCPESLWAVPTLECEFEVFPVPLCFDLNVDTPWTTPANAPVTIWFDWSGNSRWWLVPWNATIVDNGAWWTSNTVTYANSGTALIEIQMDGTANGVPVSTLCTKTIIIWDGALPDPIVLQEDDTPEDPCGTPPSGTSISYAPQGIDLLFAWWLSSFCDADFSPNVNFSPSQQQYTWSCPQMSAWEVCFIDVLPETVTCDDAWVVIWWIDASGTTSIGNAVNVNRWTLTKPWVSFTSILLVNNANGSSIDSSSQQAWVMNEYIDPSIYANNNTLTLSYEIENQFGWSASCSQVITIEWEEPECGDNAKYYLIEETEYKGAFCDWFSLSGATPVFPAPGETENRVCTDGATTVDCTAEREPEETECGWMDTQVVSTFSDRFNDGERFKPAYCENPDDDMQWFAESSAGRDWTCIPASWWTPAECMAINIDSPSCADVQVWLSPNNIIAWETETITVTWPSWISWISISWDASWTSWTIPNASSSTVQIDVTITNNSGGSSTCGIPLTVFPTIAFVAWQTGSTFWWWGDWVSQTDTANYQQWLDDNGYDQNNNWIADYNEDVFNAADDSGTSPSDSTPGTDPADSSDPSNATDPAQTPDNGTTNPSDPTNPWDTTSPTDPQVDEDKEEIPPEECYSKIWADCPSSDSSSNQFNTTWWSDVEKAWLEYVQNGACIYNGPWDNNTDFWDDQLVTNEAWLKILARLAGLVEWWVQWPLQMEVHGEGLVEAGIISQGSLNTLINAPQGVVNENAALDTLLALRDFMWVDPQVASDELDKMKNISDWGAFTRKESLGYSAKALKVIEEHASNDQCQSEPLMKGTDRVKVGGWG